MKIAYLGYDFFFECLQKIHDQKHNIVRIFSYECDNVKYNYNNKIFDYAASYGVACTVERIREHHITELVAAGCELIVSAGYPYRIPNLSKHGLVGINIHPTLLPEGRGPWPLPYLILKKHEVSGVTIHKIEDSFDTGDIIGQERFAVSEDENLETISAKSQMIAADLIDKVLRSWPTVLSAATQQGAGSYWSAPTLADRTIIWSDPVDVIDRVVRAFGKFDSCAQFDGTDWIVQDARVWKAQHAHKPGTVVHRMTNEVVIAAGDGYVCLRYYHEDP